MWDELENALAWYAAAPHRWVTSAKTDLSAAAEWIWVVLQGDFADKLTTAQTVTGTVISMIPFVDQLCDVRDIVANCKKINADRSNKWAWVALVLTLIGLFPTLGSLVKGGFKVLFAYGRKALRGATKEALDAGMWAASKPWVERGIQKFNEFLARPEVRKTLKALKIDNPYKFFAKQLRDCSGKLNVRMLTVAMDTGIGTLGKFTELIDKWGSAAMRTQTGQLLGVVRQVRGQADARLAEVLKPGQDWLNSLARRLEVEADMSYRAYTNTVNPHAFKKPSLDVEVAAFRTDKPAWVDMRTRPANPPLEMPPSIPYGYPNVNAKSGLLKSKFDTFHTMAPLEIPPGTTLYRVLDPVSADNNICWMTKAEFDKLNSKDDWRRRFAVWASWNSNGEFVTYVVPPGRPLKVWEGITGSQELRDMAGSAVSAGAGGKKFFLEGGARQIVLDPVELDKAHLGKRQPTGWGYSNFGETTSMVGVPNLANNWYEPRK